MKTSRIIEDAIKKISIHRAELLLTRAGFEKFESSSQRQEIAERLEEVNQEIETTEHTLKRLLPLIGDDWDTRSIFSDHFDAFVFGSTLSTKEQEQQDRAIIDRLRSYIGKPVRLDRSSCNGEIICDGIGILIEVNDTEPCTVDFGERGKFYPCSRDIIPIEDEPSQVEGNS